MIEKIKQMKGDKLTFKNIKMSNYVNYREKIQKMKNPKRTYCQYIITKNNCPLR